MSSLPDLKGNKVLVTGHTGFKGSWFCKILDMCGADVYGYSLDPPTQPNLFTLSGIGGMVTTKIGDVADFDSLFAFFEEVQPEYVIHMAAQPIVREGYRNPRNTYLTNVMGTVNILECIRRTDCCRSFLNVTTDKVYEESDGDPRMESDKLDGFDPYSNSKSCSDIITQCYRRSFPGELGCPVSTVRAGNVIGGGDFVSRIIPDCIVAALSGKPIELRNPHSVRPYQHVLEPLAAYLEILLTQAEDPLKAGSYNVGPGAEDCITTGELADLFCRTWGEGLSWKAVGNNGPHEADFLRLDCSLVRETFGYVPRWHIGDAVEKTVEWTRTWNDGGDIPSVMEKQIREYFGE